MPLCEKFEPVSPYAKGLSLCRDCHTCDGAVVIGEVTPRTGKREAFIDSQIPGFCPHCGAEDPTR